MTKAPEQGRASRDDLVRLIVSLGTLVIGAVGVTLYPRPHYLWLPSLILLILSLGMLVWLVTRFVMHSR